MKKRLKSKRYSGTPQAKPDVEGLINRLLQQLIFLEKKIDTLISLSPNRPREEKPFPQPFKRFENAPRQDKERQGYHSRGRHFTRVICADCNKECEVPFKPSAGRPVYCKECFSSRKGNSVSTPKQDNRLEEVARAQAPSFNRQKRGKGKRFGKKKRQSSRKRRR